MNELIFKELKVQHLVKKSLKHSYISIQATSHGALVLLKTPKVSTHFIENLLIEKEHWIRKQIQKVENSQQCSVKLEDEIILFGEVYSIDSPEAKALRDKLNRTSPDNLKRVLKHYDEFYKLRAKEYLPQRIQHFSELMGLEYSELKFRKMRRRWGSCSSKRVITLNSELIKVKKELIDYVLVHELAHLVHMNHSKKFHSLVDLYIDESQKKRKELKSIYLAFDLK